MPGVLGLIAISVGLVCILGDQHISRAVWKEGEPESGAASTRMLGLILFVAGGLTFLAWMP
jgi:hypothetical protein